MAKIIDSGQDGQLDFFGPERLGLEARINGVLNEPTPENLELFSKNLSVLRSSPVVDSSTVESIAKLVKFLPDRAFVDDLTDELMVDVVTAAVEAAGIISRFSGWSKNAKGALYVNSLGLVDWLEQHAEVATTRHFAISAASVGLFYGHPFDLSRAYSYLDEYAAERRSDLGYDWAGSVDDKVVPLHRSLSGLSMVDKTTKPVSRLHQVHLDQTEKAAEYLGLEPPRAEATLDLVRLLYLADKNPKLARRVIHHATDNGIELSQDIVRSRIFAKHGGKPEEKLIRFVLTEIKAAA